MLYVPAAERSKIGHITPSSNTVLEPLTACISAAVAAPVSHHFSRIAVQSISLGAESTSHFAPGPMLDAAALLADACVDAIVWNGTSGAWLGFDADRALCGLIEDLTGIPASTSTLAQAEAMRALGTTRFGLAVPYRDDVTARIVEVYEQEGLQAVCVSNARVETNREMAHVSEERVRAIIRAADHPDAECIAVICTGMAAAQLVHELELELGKPIVDSVAVVLWKALAMAGIEPTAPGWGTLLAGGVVPAAPIPVLSQHVDVPPPIQGESP
ncbi:MAG: maleate isomerase [Solirubrobacteraceae bacterium]|jgi:maleate isomerase|nr:maleate isomerase [Solirubrobacteraceae bacterium]